MARAARGKSLSNSVEREFSAIKRMVSAMWRCQAFRSAAISMAGIEIMPLILEGRWRSTGKPPPPQQFDALAR
jgi:transposase-like protein